MRRTTLQIQADRRAESLRSSVAADIARLRVDSGIPLKLLADAAGVDRTTIARMESGQLSPTLETYARVAAALGADLTLRLYPNTGPAVRDHLQVPVTETLLAGLHHRWLRDTETRVTTPSKGWIDAALCDPWARVALAVEIESVLRAIERVIRWSGEKARSLPSSDVWPSWSEGGHPLSISQLLIVRRTRLNREAAAAARHQLRAAFPADSRDALDSLTGTAAWPGSALLWAVEDPVGRVTLVPWEG